MQKSYNEVVLILIASTVLILLLATIIVIALLIQQKRKFRHRQQLVEMKSQYENTLLKTQLEVQEQTFKAISQNLHDNIASDISTAMLLLHPHSGITSQLSEQNKSIALQTLDKVIEDMKNLARYMNPSFLSSIGLEEAIRRQLNFIDRSASIQTSFLVTGNGMKLPQEKEIVMFRIFQECLTNTLHHAHAHQIKVSLLKNKQRMEMQIADDGCGFEAGAYNPGSSETKGSGLINMRERAQLIGATLKIDTKQNKGTKVVISLPVTEINHLETKQTVLLYQ
jgi:two-component system NarL family sensor kinase